MSQNHSERIKAVVVVSDLHVGSTIGLWPTAFVSQEDVPVGQSRFQKWLWECWIDLAKQIEGYLGNTKYVVVVNGDIVEGLHHNSTQIMTANPTDQTEAVKKVLYPLIKRSYSLFFTKGTEIHTRDREITVGNALAAVQDPSTGQHAFDKLYLNINGCLCIFRHHITATTRPYLEATALSTELGSERIEAARNMHPIPKVLCVAHRHRHGIFRDSGGIVTVTGGWQGLTRHGHKVVGSAVPNPSAIVLDWRNKRKGELPVVEDFVYSPKAPKPIDI